MFRYICHVLECRRLPSKVRLKWRLFDLFLPKLIMKPMNLVNTVKSLTIKISFLLNNEHLCFHTKCLAKQNKLLKKEHRQFNQLGLTPTIWKIQSFKFPKHPKFPPFLSNLPKNIKIHQNVSPLTNFDRFPAIYSCKII